MERTERIISNLVFFFLLLLAILLIFEDYVQIPFWLQPLGRMHPLVLHFPIGFIVLLVLINLFRKQLDEVVYHKANKFLLLLTVLTTATATMMGFFLSQEPGYSSDIMIWHKWVGVIVNYVMYGLILSYHIKAIYQILLYAAFFGTIVAGHFGAGLTHGANFLIEPILKTQKLEINENTPIFTAFVQPVFESKCKSCHNPEKHKGELDMSTLNKIHRGGENGPVWVAGDAENSELIRRAQLPLDDEDHMPPEGKAQLTASELDFIKKWIENGADEAITMAQLAKSDTLHMLAASRLSETNKEKDQSVYTFDFAEEELIASLNNPYRTVVRRSLKSPAIDVNIYGKQAFKLTSLTELMEVREQVVSLNLSYLPINDDAFDIISKLANLEKLNLNFTDVTAENLSSLVSCVNLTSLSLSGTKINSNISDALRELPGLQEVFVWNTSISESELKVLQKDFPKIKFVQGYLSNSEGAMKLTSPRLLSNSTVITKDDEIVLGHKLNEVDIRYTTDNSEPDSISKQYTKPLFFDSNVTLRAKAFKGGWLPSEIQNFNFIQKGFHPELVELIYQPDNKFKASGAASLVDGTRGKLEDIPLFYWLGYKEHPMTALVDFGNSQPKLSQLVLSYGVMVSQKIIAPASVEVWGGNEKQDLVLLAESKPPQTEKSSPDGINTFSIQLKESHYRYYKIVAKPTNIPTKGPDKKAEKGWMLIDEIFFY